MTISAVEELISVFARRRKRNTQYVKYSGG